MEHVESRDGGVPALVLEWLRKRAEARVLPPTPAKESALWLAGRLFIFPWAEQRTPTLEEALVALAQAA